MKLKKEHIKIIQNDFSQIETKDDLLNLLNLVNTYIYRTKYSPLKISQLNYYADPNKSKNRYSTFEVNKKSGGSRQINAPINGLKTILKSLNLIIQSISEPHRLAFGFVNEKSIVDNAKIHLNKNYVYNIDLKDFFHSFDRNKVKLVFLKEPFNLNGDKEPLAFLLASICTHPLLIENETKIVLPQGSPSSPTLTNIICIPLDRRLNGLAKKYGVKYSRYADDITFSSDYNIFNKTEFQTELKRIIEEDQLLKINPNKTRLQNTIYRQEVTGLTVSDKVNVQKRYVKQIRMWIYYWEKYGYIRAQQIFKSDYIKDKGHIIKSDFIIDKGLSRNSSLSRVLDGKLNYLKMVKGENDSTYLKLKNRFTKLNEKNESSYLNRIINIWEKIGIDQAMTLYYSSNFISKPSKIKNNLILSSITFGNFKLNNNLKNG